MTSSSVDGSWNLNGKYKILKPANQVFGLIMEIICHLEGFKLWSIFVSLGTLNSFQI